jgi:hypothetical protein
MMRRAGVGFARLLNLLTVLMALAAAVFWPAVQAGAAVPASRLSAPEPTLMDVAILVDESGSLSPADVREEIKATATIASGGLNPKSRVSVYGFGSQNSVGQNPITVACQPTTLDSAVKVDALGACIKKLHRRSAAEGNDTDHAAALATAVSTLQSGGPDKALRVVFLLTDGRLDVSRSPNYGRIPGDRNAEAQRQVKTQLGLAATNHIQVWPLGFGSNIDTAALNAFAAGGDRQACDERPESKPTARVVHDSRDVLRSLTQAFAAASCSGVSQSDSATLEAGATRDLKIDIPIIATDGSITVAKGDPKVRVDFKDPTGRTVPTSGNVGESQFKRAGENSTVETLNVVNPVNGTWTVRLTAPHSMSRQLVSATAIWQGAVSSSIVVEPPTARTGQPLTVRLSLVTRQGAIADAKALSGLNFTVQAVGPTLAGPQSIVVRDDGKSPDDRAHDGRYAGTFTAPDRAGDLTFTGVVSGYGVLAEKVPVTVAVSANAPALQGRVEFSSNAVVYPGSQVTGTVSMENGGPQVPGRLVLEGSERARATLRGSTDFTIQPGRTTRAFSVAFPRDAGLGGSSLTVKVVNAGDLSKVYANGQLTVTVKKVPGWPQRHRYEIAGALVLLLLLAAFAWLRRQAHRRKVDVRGLQASLRQDGEQIGPALKAPRKWAAEFRFVIRDVETGTPRLDFPRPGDQVLRARRGSAGTVMVSTPAGERYEIAIGSEGEPVEEVGLTLAFNDTRSRRSARARARSTRPKGARRAAGSSGSTGSTGPERSPAEATPDPATTPARPSTYDDPWL